MDYRTLKYVPLATASTVLLPLVAKAQNASGGVTTGSGVVPALAPTNASGTDANFGLLVSNVILIILWVATVVAIIYLLLSGFNYITAGGDQEKADGARKGIINAIIGIVVIMAAFFIFNAAKGFGGGLGSGTTEGIGI